MKKLILPSSQNGDGLLFLTLFLVSATLLSYEVLLTRIISAMFVKYFSLLAISMAMMGLGAAGVLIQVYMGRFSPKNQSKILSIAAYGLPASLFFFPLFVNIVQVPSFFLQFSDLCSVFLFIFVCIMPFFFGGLILADSYQRWSKVISKLYFSDLLGAAAGCGAAFFALNQTDGLSAIFFTAVLGSSIALIQAMSQDRRKKIISTLIFLFFLSSFAANHFGHILTLPHPTGRKNVNIWEKWSEFGLTTVAKSSHFSGVGISEKYKPLKSSLFKAINHDYNSLTLAVTPSMQGKELETYKNQIMNFPLQFMEKPKVLVLGSGGGKEVYSALLCGSGDVTAVEFNRIIAQDVMQDYLKDFSGGIYNRPKVKLLVDEARNYLNRNNEKFDVILPVTGTTPRLLAAGCYVFSSEYLQTVEAYQSYLDHLADKGIYCYKASISKDKVNEITPHYRMLATMKEVLSKRGLPPEKHILVIGGGSDLSYGADYSLAAMFSPSPFTEADIRRAQEITRKMGFEILFSSYSQKNDLLSRFIKSANMEAFYASPGMDIRPVIDDRPYYYHYLKADTNWELDSLPDYFRLLVVISVIFLVYIIILMFLPLMLSSKTDLKKGFGGNILALLYFAALGIGFIGLELTLMQKANFLLGIPSWGFLITVSSFTLMMGLGALTAGKTSIEKIKKRIWLILSAVSGLLLIYHFLFPDLLLLVTNWDNSHKMALVFVLLAPLGFLLGMPFVWGIRLLKENGRGGTIAWMWAVNSTTSTMGAVGVVLLWITYGHINTILIFLGIYLLSAILLSFFPSR